MVAGWVGRSVGRLVGRCICQLLQTPKKKAWFKKLVHRDILVIFISRVKSFRQVDLSDE